MDRLEQLLLAAEGQAIPDYSRFKEYLLFEAERAILDDMQIVYIKQLIDGDIDDLLKAKTIINDHTQKTPVEQFNEFARNF